MAGQCGCARTKGLTIKGMGGRSDRQTLPLIDCLCDDAEHLKLHSLIYSLLFLAWPATPYLGPNFSSTLVPCSSHSCLVIHIFSLSAMMLAKTAPPKKTICRRRGGILYPNPELAQPLRVAAEDSCQP